MAGMNDHVSKPIDAVSLCDALNRWTSTERILSKSQSIVPSVPQPISLPEEDEDGLPAELPPFQLSTALALMNGDRKLLKTLLKTFCSHYANAPEQIMLQVDQGETHELHRLAHTIKGVAGSLGANELFRTAGALETALNNDPSSDVHGMATELSDLVRIALSSANKLK